MRLAAVAFSLLTLLALPAAATTYYVATNGSDTNNGTTLTTPFATINHAASVAVAGDTVYVRGGVYRQTVSIYNDGQSTAHVLFSSYPGETATIDGSNTSAGTVLVNFYDANYVDFKNFEVANATHVGISLWASKNCLLANNVVHNCLKSGIYVGADNLGQSSDNTVSGNRVYNCVMENTAHTSGGTSLGVSKSDRVTVTGNTVYENHGQGITYSGGGNSGLITQNTCYDNYNINIALTDTTSTVVERNLLYGDGNTTYYDAGQPPHGIGLTGTIDSAVIRNNIIVNGRWALYFYGSSGRVLNSQLANNTVYNVTTRMISIAASTLGHSNNVVENNIFRQGPGQTTTLATTASGFTFRNNAWYGGSAGTAAGTGDVTVDPLLTNAGGLTALDYKLQSTSACIDTGYANSMANDYWGTSRSGSIDIGAHEFGTGSTGPKIWYVSTTGSDTNAGTYAAPFATIAKADTVVQPGDVVSVRGGTYMLSDRLTIAAKGTAAAPIIYRSHPGETAIIDGTNVSGKNEMLMLYRTDYVDFENFEVRNSASLCITGWAITNTRILNNKIHGCVRNGITITHDNYGEPHDVTISGNEVYDTVRENMPPNSPFPNGGWGQAVGMGRTVRGTITYNKVHENWGEGIVVGNSESVYVGHNVSYDNFSCLYYIDHAFYTTYDANLGYNTNNSQFYRFNDVSHGLLMANEYDSTTTHLLHDNRIINNILINTRYALGYVDIEQGGGMPNTLIANNTVYKASLTAMRIEDDVHTGTVVENNIFYQPNAQTAGYYAGSGVTFHTNAWYGSTPPTNMQATGDVTTNPLLVNPGTYVATDYKLQSTSPCIGAGTANSVTTDYWGTSRTAPWSIGAQEY